MGRKKQHGEGCQWMRRLWRLRGLFLALPVLWAAVKLAIGNWIRLPELVGLNLQATGEFAWTISRKWAVFGPLGVTLFCLLLTICSRKPLFPWIISVFSLLLPILIWMTNYYA